MASTGKPAPASAAARAPRPARGVGAGAGGDKGPRAAKPAKKGPANQDDLDKELAAFMKTDEPAAPPAAAAVPTGGEAAMEE